MTPEVQASGDMPLIHFVETLGDHPRLFATVLNAYADGIAEGHFPADRHVPTGTESCAFYALDDVEPIAFATFYQPQDDRPFYWLDLLWVEPEFRGRGIGGELVSFISDRATLAGMDRIEFGTLVGNDAMLRFARQLNADEFSVTFRLNLQHDGGGHV